MPAQFELWFRSDLVTAQIWFNFETFLHCILNIPYWMSQKQNIVRSSHGCIMKYKNHSTRLKINKLEAKCIDNF